LNREKLTGLLLGLGGVIVLFVPELLGGIRLTVWGMAAILAGAASYGVAFMYTRQTMRGLPPLAAPTAQLAFAAVYLVPLALLVEQPYMRPSPTAPTVAALLMLVLLSTVLAFALYYRLMEETDSTTLSLVTYLNPIVATILGVILLHEPLGWPVYLGCGLVLLGAARVNGNRFAPKALLRLSTSQHPRERTTAS
jgi:drug/metabolite transporter (DMT)-like permease